jgi:hypothetical protein
MMLADEPGGDEGGAARPTAANKTGGKTRVTRQQKASRVFSCCCGIGRDNTGARDEKKRTTQASADDSFTADELMVEHRVEASARN